MKATTYDSSEFQKIFSGNTEAFGRHIPDKEVSEANPEKKKQGKSFTITERLSYTNYYSHLEGKEGLGIVPLTKEGKVKFIVIDIDNYNEKYTERIVDKIYSNKLPLVPFRSKSGGLHLYLFFDKHYEYLEIQKLIREFIPVLGLENKVEVFPKQLKLKQGQVGNWINLPYFNHEKTKQYLISDEYKGLSLQVALNIIKSKTLSLDEFKKSLDSVSLNDAPPCLQCIYYERETDQRNEYLFNMAVYLKSKHSDNFEEELFDCNNDLLKPLPVKEVMDTIVKSHKRKDYGYRCSISPLKDSCIKEICRQRQFGIGGDNISELSYEDFTQHTSDPPYYEWKVNGKDLVFFSEADILNQNRFRELCIRELHIMPIRLKDISWSRIVNRALKNMIVKEIEIDEDMSPGSTFMKHLYDYLENRVPAESLSQILIDRVYLDEKKKLYIFKGQDLLDFLFEIKKFRYFRTTEIQNRLKKMGSTNARIYIDKNNKGVRVWKLPISIMKDFKFDPTEGLEVDFTKMGEFKDEEHY